MIQGLRSLEAEIWNPNAASFSANLKKFSASFQYTNTRHLTSFHALTTVFEFFALYLMFRVCRTGLLIPQSWIDIHLPWFVGHQGSLSSEALPENSIHTYRRCLMDLTRDFTRMISQLDPSASSDLWRGFRLGRHFYLSRVLHRRNVELLSVAIINLRATGVDLPSVTGVWAEVSKVNRIERFRFELQSLPSTRPSRFIFSVPITFNTEPFRNSSRNWSSHMASTRVKTPLNSLSVLQDTTISKACCRNSGYRLARLKASFPRSPDHGIRRRLSLRLGQQRNMTRITPRRCVRFNGSGDMYTPKSKRREIL